MANIVLSLERTRLVASESSSWLRAGEINPLREALSVETGFPHDKPLEVTAAGRFALLGNSGGSPWPCELASGKAVWSHHAVEGVFVSGSRFVTRKRGGVLFCRPLPAE